MDRRALQGDRSRQVAQVLQPRLDGLQAREGGRDIPRQCPVRDDLPQ